MYLCPLDSHQTIYVNALERRPHFLFSEHRSRTLHFSYHFRLSNERKKTLFDFLHSVEFVWLHGARINLQNANTIFDVHGMISLLLLYSSATRVRNAFTDVSAVK